MKTKIILNKLITRTLSLIKVNMVLVMPFLIFLLILVIVLSPLSGFNPFVLLALIALEGAFVAGWLNMFHMCLEYAQNESIPDDQKALNSLSLYKEFFPGVGKHFWNFFSGIGFYIILLLVIVAVAEAIAHYFVGNIKSLDAITNQTIPAFSSKAEVIDFWHKIAHGDKIKIAIVLAFDWIFLGLFSYLTMFWPQSVIVEGKNPINAFVSSIKTVLKDPINTLLMFILIVVSFSLIFVLNLIISANILSQLLILMLFAYVIVYYIMMQFLYFERYR